MKLGIVGWRGMVGSVLIDRMTQEDDFARFETTLFSTSQAGEKAPNIKGIAPILADANNIDLISKLDVLITCQGSDYTKEMHTALRKAGWKGYWIDAASSLRMEKDAVIILDPVNASVIESAVASGVRDFIGGNCTVSLMMLGIGGLLEKGLVEWITSMTYQAASGAGAKNMEELLAQSKFVGDDYIEFTKKNPGTSILEVERRLMKRIQDNDFPKENFGHALSLNLLPWIDTKVESGQSREEWKACAEANKILQTQKQIPIDGTCVRVGSLRCHAQGLTIKLKKDIPLDEIETIIREHNPWVKFVANNKEETLRELTPASVAGTLDIAVGRVRKMNLGPEYLNVFTLGDQLLWGAAEPLRRMLKFVK